MRRTRWRRMVVVLVVVSGLLAGYVVWSRADRSVPSGQVDARLECVEDIGHDSGAGNLLAIQPYMEPSDYASAERFRDKLDCYFAEAKKRGWLGRKTVVVLPEYLGAWLVVEGEKQGAQRARTVSDAMKLVVLSNVCSVVRNAVSAPASDRLRYAIFSMKSRRMAEIYDRVLSGLARKYEVMVVGGSIVLASPKVVEGKLTSNGGPLYNVTPVYLPDGKCAPQLVVKCFLTEDEQGWMQGGDVKDLPVFTSPVGKLGVLTCADTWFPDSYRVLKRKGVRVVVADSFRMASHSVDEKWTGYSGQKTPSDVLQTDIGTLTPQEAWTKYAFAGRMTTSGARSGVMAVLRGHLWDLLSEGSTVVVRDGHTVPTKVVNAGAIVNVWLP